MHLITDDEDGPRYIDHVVFSSSGVRRQSNSKWQGASLRCIKDDNSTINGLKKNENTGDFMVRKVFDANQSTLVFEMNIKQPGRVELFLFTITGKKIKEFTSDIANPGIHRVNWDGISYDGDMISNGTYYYQLIIGNEQRTGQFIYVR